MINGENTAKFPGNNLVSSQNNFSQQNNSKITNLPLPVNSEFNGKNPRKSEEQGLNLNGNYLTPSGSLQTPGLQSLNSIEQHNTGIQNLENE